MMKLIRNRIMCNACKDIIESKTVHDYRTCSCGKVSIDGGTYYTQVNYLGDEQMGKDERPYVDYSVYEKDEDPYGVKELTNLPEKEKEKEKENKKEEEEEGLTS